MTAEIEAAPRIRGASPAHLARSLRWRWNGNIWNAPPWYVQARAAASPFLSQLGQFGLMPIYFRDDIEDFALNGTIVVRIAAFDAKRLRREIVMVRPDGTQHAVPQPTGPAVFRTRWDMMLKPFFGTSGKQRIRIAYQLADPLLRFLWTGSFPITAKEEASQKLLANPLYDQPGGRTISVDLLFDPTDPELRGTASYNLGLLVRDRDDASFCLPLIVDPRMGNDGNP